LLAGNISAFDPNSDTPTSLCRRSEAPIKVLL
jgi:hypothetical protein